MRALVIAAVFLVLSPASASAGWQKTQWGMTVDDVARLYPDAVPVSEKEQRTRTIRSHTPLLKREYDTGTFAFRLEFAFNDAGRLSQVVLELADNSRRLALLKALLDRYGDPVTRTPSQLKWVDGENENLVILLLYATAQILYQPGGRVSPKGL